MAREPRIKITYAITDPDSEGDADTGWIDEDGVSMELDDVDLDDDVTHADKAVDYLKREGAVYPSSSAFHKGVWYSTEWQQNYRTGEEEERSYHLYDFTEKEQRDIFERIVGVLEVLPILL